MKRPNILLIIFFIQLTFGCKKSEPSLLDSKKSFSEILNNKNWRVSAIYVISDTSFYDSYLNVDSCLKDDYTKFTLDSQITIYSGILKCKPNEPTSKSDAVWYVTENDKMFNYKSKINFITTQFSIIEKSENQFVLEESLNLAGQKIKRQIKYIAI